MIASNKGKSAHKEEDPMRKILLSLMALLLVTSSLNRHSEHFNSLGLKCNPPRYVF